MTGITNGNTVGSRRTDGTRHAVIKRLIRMLAVIVITVMRLRHRGVTGIEDRRRIVAVMAVMMVRHVRVHIRLIMIQVHRSRLRVIRWIIPPVIG